MPAVPNHGPGCFKVRSNPSTCPRCKQKVVYFECTCGSKVYLDPPNGGEHFCTGQRREMKYPPIVRRWGPR